MSSVKPTGFCTRCQRTVVLDREQLDTCLFLVLLFFTVIGGIIYYIIYKNKPMNRCVHCSTVISYVDSRQYSQQRYQGQSSQEQSLQSQEPIKEGKKYCEYCGEKINPGIKFCHNCGARV